MATGDVTIVVQVEGGSAKTATIASAVRVNALAWLNMNRGDSDNPNLTNTTWSALMANNAADRVIRAAEKQLISAAAPTTPTFTAAS